MRKLVASIVLLASTLFGIEVPINKSVTLDIHFGDMTVIEFPFEIRGVNSATFHPKYRIKKDAESTVLDMMQSDTESKTVIDETTGKKKTVKKHLNKNKRSIIIKRGKNTVTLIPKKFGTLDLVIWGYGHPIMLQINVVKEETPKYYSFTDFSKKKKLVKKFESVAHEKVIIKLSRHLFNNKTPDGYELRAGHSEFTSGDLNFVQSRTLIGNLYSADLYFVENGSGDVIRLYEEMFYSEGIYSIAFENDVLEPGEKIRMFIIRKTDKKG